MAIKTKERQKRKGKNRTEYGEKTTCVVMGVRERSSLIALIAILIPLDAIFEFESC